MLRLVKSSNPDDVSRFEVRAHYTQRLVLTASLAQELNRDTQKLVNPRIGAAFELLAWWMRSVYDAADGDIKYTHGLDDPKLSEFAGDLAQELRAGAAVCEALTMLYTADKDWEYEGDAERLRASLRSYFAAVDK
ncbi:MAG: hypothetical protein WBB00_29245 [Mycobacterium sp.]